MKKAMILYIVVFLCSLALVTGVQARDNDPVGMTPTTEDADGTAQKPGYSPYAQRGFPTQVYWGDTHVHTDNSLDARGFGVTIGPEEAFRFARGEEVITSNGLPFKLSRPLDWLVVADHSDGMGAMKEIIAGNPNLLKDPEVKKWYTAMRAGVEEDIQHETTTYANPLLVPYFFDETGADALAVAYGTSHGPNKGQGLDQLAVHIVESDLWVF